MLDLEKLRAENRARLLGQTQAPADKVARITKEQLAEDPEAAWHIISLATKPKTEKLDNGRTKTLKERQYPQLAESVTVGEIQAKKRGAKNDGRTNIETMREMYSIRNKVNRFVIGEESDKYAEFFMSIVEMLDAYAMTAAVDLLEANPNLLQQVYEIDLAENAAMQDRLAKAREKR